MSQKKTDTAKPLTQRATEAGFARVDSRPADNYLHLIFVGYDSGEKKSDPIAAVQAVLKEAALKPLVVPRVVHAIDGLCVSVVVATPDAPQAATPAADEPQPPQAKPEEPTA